MEVRAGVWKAFLAFVSLGLTSGLADACKLNGPRYGLGSDVVQWSLEVTGTENCTRSARLRDVVLDKLVVVSGPQTGRVYVVGPGFSYKAPGNFQGSDRFVLEVAGSIRGSSGNSRIEILVSVSGVGEARRSPSVAASAGNTAPDGDGGTLIVDPARGRIYPNATNTGVPAGTVLKSSGPLGLRTPGQVVSGLDITGGVDIGASNVTLENCVIHVADPATDWMVSVRGNLSGVVIRNCEIIGPGLSATSQNAGIYIIDSSQVTISAVNIHQAGHGIDVSGGPVVVENSYIHDLNAASSSHYDGIYFGGGSAPNFSLQIRNNTIINRNAQTSAIFIENYFGPINDISVKNNLLVGGGYTVYLVSNTQSNGGGGQGGAVSNVSYTNNHIGSGYYGFTDFSGPYHPFYAGNVNDGAVLAAALPVSPVVAAASATAGTYSTGNTVILTLYTSEAVEVSGFPTLTLSNGATATYTGSPSSVSLTFSYTVANGQNTSALSVTAINGTITDYDGHKLSTSNLSANFAGVSIDGPDASLPLR
jgi:hypothetical protein